MKKIDIFSIPVYYISFEKNKGTEDRFRKQGFQNIHHHKAVNGRKLNMKKLLENNIISIRSYDDLILGRIEHSGMPSAGAIGCTLSHYELWKKCLQNNWDYIIIGEEDVYFPHKFTQDEVEYMKKTISQENGLFMGRKIDDIEHRKHFFGTHFYIASKGACQKLIRKAFPIDVQTDWYIGHLATVGDIRMNGLEISNQIQHDSIIQADCITCRLPRGNWFYIAIAFLIVILIVCILILSYKSENHALSLQSCLESKSASS